MKRIYLLNLFLLILLSGCKKSNVEPIQSTLIGKWVFTEQFVSQGPPGAWQPASPPGQTIEFKSDGTFVPCQSFEKDADQFEIVDSVTVRFQPAVVMGTMTYSIDTIARELVLTPNPNCIEGCAYKFKR